MLCAFDAGGEGELSVHRGEFVTVVVDAEDPAPEGWCYCQVARRAPSPSAWAAGPPRALTEEGLVPWYFLVSAAHAEQEAMARPLPSADAQGGTWHDIRVRRGQHGALGLDVNQHNCICRISPGSAAAQDGHLRPGDVVHEVDAKPLLGFCLATSIDPALQAYVLRVYRPPFDALSIESITSGVMCVT